MAEPGVLVEGESARAGLGSYGGVVFLAEQTSFNPLGDNLLAWMLLAFGGAMLIGNVLALVRPPAPDGDAADGAPVRAPLARTVVMIALGLVAAGWALATLLSG